MNLPEIPNIVAQMAQLKAKQGYTNAALAALLDVFGFGPWVEAHLDDLFAGRTRPTADEEMFFQRYLLNAFYVYNSS